jgi:hypothetical protein
LKRIREEKGKKVKEEALCGPLREFPTFDKVASERSPK